MTTVAEVMTRDVAAVRKSTPFKRIVELMAERKVSAVPVVNAHGVPVGLVSEADLLPKTEYRSGQTHASFVERLKRPDEVAKAEGTLATDLMTWWPITIRPDVRLAEAARRMLHARIKRLLVVGERGELIGIVSRSDLLGTFLRSDQEIRREIVDDVLGRQLAMNPLRFAVSVRDGVVTLIGQVERRAQVPLVEGVVRAVDGVVQLDSHLTWATDDGPSGAAVPWIMPYRQRDRSAR